MSDQASSTQQTARSERQARTAELLLRRDQATTDEERRTIIAEIVLVNRGVAVAIAMRYRNRGVPLDDLCQTAYEGLTKAVMRFDGSLADELLTYAVPTIRGELQRQFRDKSWLVRPPRRVQELQQQVRLATDELSQVLGHEPTSADLAEHLEVDQAAVSEAQRAHDCFTPLSLDQPVGADASATLTDMLPDPDGETHELVDARVSLAPAVRRLSERDRRILYLRFFEDRTQSEIGSALGVSQMQVSRLLARALGELREALS